MQGSRKLEEDVFGWKRAGMAERNEKRNRELKWQSGLAKQGNSGDAFVGGMHEAVCVCV